MAGCTPEQSRSWWRRACLWAARSYPRRWRHRYGEELLSLIEESPCSFRILVDVVGGSISEWMEELSIKRVVSHAALVLVAAYAVALTATLGWLMGNTLGRWLWRTIVGPFVTGPLSAGPPLGALMRDAVAQSTSLGVWTAVFLGYSVLFSAPLLVLWKLTGFGRRWPGTARATYLCGFLSFSVYFRPQLDLLLAMSLAGCVIAIAVFRRCRPRASERIDVPSTPPVSRLRHKRELPALWFPSSVAILSLILAVVTSSFPIGESAASRTGDLLFLALVGTASAVAAKSWQPGGTTRAFRRGLLAGVLATSGFVVLTIGWVRLAAGHLIQLPFGFGRRPPLVAPSSAEFLFSGVWDDFWIGLSANIVTMLPLLAFAALAGALAGMLSARVSGAWRMARTS